MRSKINPRVLYTLLSAFIIIVSTVFTIQYAQGRYRFTKEGVYKESGLLSANSFPTGAQVYVDDKLLTATNDTLYFKPGEYSVEIKKEGYSPWKKILRIEKELVTQTNAQLFPIVPSLTPLTFSGVNRILPSPDGQKLLFITATASSESKNGLFILELTNSLLSLQKGPEQIAQLPEHIDLLSSKFIWSPDSSQIMMVSPQKEVVLESNKKQDILLLPDIRYQRKSILSEWEEEIYLRERQFLSKFPKDIIQMATASATNVYLSPDKKRLLYTATENFTIKKDLLPPVLSSNTQPESRAVESGNTYVYDMEEDKNFFVGSTSHFQKQDNDKSKNQHNLSEKLLLATDLFSRKPIRLEASPSAFLKLQGQEIEQTAQLFNNHYSPLHTNTLQWFPDSKHLFYAKDDHIGIKSYDNTNNTEIYSGPFESDFVYPWPDGSKLLILTSFSTDTPINLYALDLKR